MRYDVSSDAMTADYSSKTDYMDETVAANYEQERFSGLLGRYRWKREQDAVGSLIGRIPQGSVILDCPCGIGRWWPHLLPRASRLIAMDISQEMLDRAASRPEVARHDIETRVGDAENLPLEDGAVDWVFSHALTKHLPWPVQYRVFSEFARVARNGVLCSFSVVSPVKYAIMQRRRMAKAYPLLEEELHWMAQWAGCRVVEAKSCTTPIGFEQTVLFEKLR